jgi:hypothetical protein
MALSTARTRPRAARRRAAAAAAQQQRQQQQQQRHPHLGLCLGPVQRGEPHDGLLGVILQGFDPGHHHGLRRVVKAVPDDLHAALLAVQIIAREHGAVERLLRELGHVLGHNTEAGLDVGPPHALVRQGLRASGGQVHVAEWGCVTGVPGGLPPYCVRHRASLDCGAQRGTAQRRQVAKTGLAHRAEPLYPSRSGSACAPGRRPGVRLRRVTGCWGARRLHRALGMAAFMFDCPSGHTRPRSRHQGMRVRSDGAVRRAPRVLAAAQLSAFKWQPI